MIALASSVLELDDLLDRIGIKLQLSSTAYSHAEDRYKAIGKLLEDKQSPLAQFKPEIYPQGSLRIGTTVKPLGRNEFDLDLVCELQAACDDFPGPVHVLNLIEARLHENKTYQGMVDPKRRCIRVTYADQFHMDILPACPSPEDGLHCVVVPDREVKKWKASNPRGYARWFESRGREAIRAHLKYMEPLSAQPAFEDLSTLQRAVQLLKRYRDIKYKDRCDLAPISIVLTTLAAEHYKGQLSLSEAMTGIIEGIIGSIPTGERLYVLNPTNPLEDLSERWDANPESYMAFKEGIFHLQDRWRRLRKIEGVQNISKLLEELFGEKVAKEVVVDHTKALTEARKNNQLGIKVGSGIIVNKASGAVEIPRNTFYGD